MTLNEWEYSPPSVQIHQDVPSKPLYVRGAQDFLTIAVSEIVRNAVTFSPENGAVTVSLREQDGFGVITVTDNGTGIASDDLSRVWERFVQINRDQFEQQGTGLGLALVSECVRLHAGECTINSTPGEGTEVTLRLPLVPSPED
jgi:two-component system sensor histidine kinase SenX3